MKAQRILVAVLALLATGCVTQVAPPQPVDLAIEHVNVIDPETARLLPDRDVLVRNGQIVGVAPSGSHRKAVAATVVDGRGRYVIPGLIDMHAHLFLPEPAEPSLILLLAHGVTAIREMSSDCWAAAGAKKGCVPEYRALQAKIRSGQIPGPDIVALTSTMVMGPTRLKLPEGAPAFITPTTDAQARTLVEHLRTRGVQLIKTHDSIPTPAFLALMEEASRAGIAVGGHVPFGAGSLGAARLGYRSIEHARDLLYDCSSYGPEFRRREAAFAAGEAGASRPSNLERLRRTVEGFDPVRCSEFLRQLAATGVYYVPTHVTREMETLATDPAYRNDPGRQYILAERNKRWETDLTETAALPVEERQALIAFFQLGLRITGLAHRAGIPIMAGTDMNDTMIIPGASMHRELGLLVRAGLTPMQALQAATTTPSRYLQRADLGGISPGKRADLVLLDANPLADIRNIGRIKAVVTAGRVFDRAKIDELLRQVQEMAATR